MSAKMFTFPQGNNTSEENILRGMKRLTDMELVGEILQANREAFDLDDNPDPSENVFIFEDDRYPLLVLVDVDCPRTKTRGLFTVDPDTFGLLRIAHDPLVHFNNEGYTSD